jgi:hypothetical protein
MSYGDTTLLIISFVFMWLYIFIQRRDPRNHIILQGLLMEGQDLHTEEIHYEEYSRWKKDYKSWLNKVEKQLLKGKGQYLTTFKAIIGLSYEGNIGYHCNVDHGRDKRKLFYYLNNLERIVNILTNQK